MFSAKQILKRCVFAPARAFSIKVGDKVPSAAVGVVKCDSEGAFTHEVVDTAAYFENKTVVLFGFPAPFTPTCTATHVPGFINAAEQIKEKGADEVIGMSLADPFCLKAFGAHLGGNHHMNFLADGNGEFTKALGLELDLSAAMLGTRSKRFSMIIKNNVVEEFNNEDGPALTDKASAETILK